MKILGYDYRVYTEGTADSMGAFGRYHAKIQGIQIAGDLHEEQKVSTVLHEIIEALNYHLELGIEHKTISILEATLYQTLTENGIDLREIAKEIL